MAGGPALLRSLGQGMLDLVFAPVCLGCGGPIPTARAERLICAACLARPRALPEPRCPRCWSPLSPTPAGVPPCGLCRELPPSLRVVRSAFLLEQPVHSLVHALKYGGWRSLAVPLGRWMASLPVPLDVEEEVRLAVPVPLSPVRRRERGYNQAELLAREVAARRGWSVDTETLERRRSTDTQTTLHPTERRANVAGAFTVRSEARGRIEGRHILLVDDVWTTGATVLACTEALVRAGARAVTAFTLARSLPELRRQRDLGAGR